MANTSTGYVNGSDFGIYDSDTLIAVGLDNQMQLSKNMINVSNKDSGTSSEYIPGRGDGTVSGSCRVKYDAGYGYQDLFSKWKSGTKLTIRYSNDTTGDDEYTFSAYINDLNRQDPDDDNSTIDYTLQITGEITESNISA
jgi:hypothetical protein